MIGFGTKNVRLHYENFDYVNLIGNDNESWGISHRGELWHSGVSKSYCEPFFDKNNRIGALINTYDKTISFFLNGKYLGIAFR